MFKITDKKQLGPGVVRFEVEAPRVAKARKPGQFVIVRVDEKGERIPLTIADVDRERGRISLIVQALGYSTTQLCGKEQGEDLLDVAGPLGRPTELEKFGHAVVVGGGVGTAVVYPQAAALKEMGNYVTGIIGGRSKELVILEEDLGRIVDDLVICTDDGSYGRKGFVTVALEDLIKSGKHPVDAVFAAGPVMMMKVLSELTRPYGIKTIVSLNPIMVDGTGMCGGCRVTVDGKSRFACVDGPEFDGHLVDFDELADRLSAYRGYEQRLAGRVEDPNCRLTVQINNLKKD